MHPSSSAYPGSGHRGNWVFPTSVSPATLSSSSRGKPRQMRCIIPRAGLGPPQGLLPAGLGPPQGLLPAGLGPPQGLLPAGLGPPQGLLPAGVPPKPSKGSCLEGVLVRRSEIISVGQFGQLQGRHDQTDAPEEDEVTFKRTQRQLTPPAPPCAALTPPPFSRASQSLSSIL